MAPERTAGQRLAATMVFRVTARRAVRSGLLWGTVFGIYVAVQATTYGSSYPTAAARHQFDASLAGNSGLAALIGPARRLDTVAGYISWRLGALSIIGAIWGLLIGTRLLRGEEDAGRWELLLAGQTTPRRATSQAIVALGAGLATLWILTWAVTATVGSGSSVGFSVSASLFYATCAVSSAVMFIAIGLFVGQLCATRRQANGLGAGLFGASFLIRMVADSTAELGWLRWASPLGWVEELRPLIGSRLLALIPIVALTSAAIAGTLLVAGRRDLDASVLANRDSAAAHTRLLGGPLSLAVRLSRSLAAGWIFGLAALGLVMGLIAQSASRALSGSATITAAIARLGGHRSGADSYLGVAFLIVAALVAFAAAGQVASTRSEEAEGHADNMLVHPVGRVSWLCGRLALSAVIVILTSMAAGLAAWIGAASQRSPVTFGALFQAGLNTVAPALFVLGFGTLVYGLSPRLASPVVYGLVSWSFIIEIIGSSINANHWLMDTAVLSHISPAPAADPNWSAVAWLVAIGAAAAALGVGAFNRRDLATA